ncbi:MAG: DUF1599 domain-containing protein [Bacteroidales bacterium]|jgi:hypothetical protein
MSSTSKQFDSVIKKSREIFEKKLHDYGSSWRIMRPRSVTDQIFIKAQRIRSIEEKGKQKVDEGIIPEYIGILNYAIIGLIQLNLGNTDNCTLQKKEIMNMYDKYAAEAKSLMENKNHDYGEAWRDMRISSFTDIILMRIMRIKQIEDLQGETFISEGIDANYYDMINYAIFALIRMEEK